MARDRFLARNAPELYVRGKLDRERAQAFEAHMLDCDRCFKEVELAERYVSGLKGLEKDPLLAEAGGEEADGWFNSAFIPRPAVLAAAVAVVVILLAGLGLWQMGRIGEGPGYPQRAALTAAWQESDRNLLPMHKADQVYRDAPVRAQLPELSRDPDGRLALFFLGSPDLIERSLRGELQNREGIALVRDLRPVALDVDDGPVLGVLIDAADLVPGDYRLAISSADAVVEQELLISQFRLLR